MSNFAFRDPLRPSQRQNSLSETLGPVPPIHLPLKLPLTGDRYRSAKAPARQKKCFGKCRPPNAVPSPKHFFGTFLGTPLGAGTFRSHFFGTFVGPGVVFSWLFRGPLLSRKTVFGPFSLLFRGFFVAPVLGKFYAYSPWNSLLRFLALVGRICETLSMHSPLKLVAKHVVSVCRNVAGILQDSFWTHKTKTREDAGAIKLKSKSFVPASLCESAPPLRAQKLKKFKILKFSSGIENFKRAAHQTPIFVGNSEGQH